MERQQIIDKAMELGFCDIGFTTAEPFETQREILRERADSYAWLAEKGTDLFAGVDPASVMPNAQSIIVLVDNYYSGAFPASLVGKFGRCYLDDDRVTRDGLAVRIKQFRAFLRDLGIDSKVPFNVPHRLAAARAGLGTFGKNCLFYAREGVRGASWVSPMAIVVDRRFEPDPPTMRLGCPDWCRNACIAACPMGALRGPQKIDPKRCISYLSYYGDGITPPELREPMGMWVYGCDRCQTVCPRNEPWTAQNLAPNPRVAAKAEDFDLIALLHMDRDYFKQRIWPHMFYMSSKDIWRWKMNVSRVMGNSHDPGYVPELLRAFRENEDERVRGMIAWAMGRLGGTEAAAFLSDQAPDAEGLVREEIERAMIALAGSIK